MEHIIRTHYTPVVKIIAWIQFFLGLILTYFILFIKNTKGLETSSDDLQVLEVKRTSEDKCLNRS